MRRARIDTWKCFKEKGVGLERPLVARYYDSYLCDCDKTAIPRSDITSAFDAPSTCLNICLYERKVAVSPKRKVVVEETWWRTVVDDMILSP